MVRTCKMQQRDKKLTKILSRKFVGHSQLGRPWSRWEDNIKLKQKLKENMDRLDLFGFRQETVAGTCKNCNEIWVL